MIKAIEIILLIYYLYVTVQGQNQFFIITRSKENNVKSKLPSARKQIDVKSTIAAKTLNKSSSLNISTELPKPTRLHKIAATTSELNLGFHNFDNVQPNDKFVVEYRSHGTDKWQRTIFSNLTESSSFTLGNLYSGILYHVKMHLQRQTTEENIVYSNKSDVLLARTKPFPVTDLNVSLSPTNWSRASVSWKAPRLEPFQSKYDEIILTYYITDPEEPFLLPRQNVTFSKPALLKTRNFEVDDFIIVPGATYRFEIVTESQGNDQMRSEIKSLTKTFSIPGPIKLRVAFENETNPRITWQPHPGIANTTSYRVIATSENGEESLQYTVNSTETRLSDLRPGSIYKIKVQSIQEENLLERFSQNTSLIIRTKPSKVSNVTVNASSPSTLTLSFSTPPVGIFSRITATFQTSDGKGEVSSVNASLNSREKTGFIYLSSLEPGALYQINITVYSQPNPTSNNSLTYFARTNPTLPTNIETTSQLGRLYMSWKAPEVYSETISQVLIDYHPLGNMNESKRICRNKGFSFEKILLPDLRAGTGYVINVSSIAGADCFSSAPRKYPRRSVTSKQIIAYSQPIYPVIKYWKQVTLNSVKLVWELQDNPESEKFDHFQIEVRRESNPDSYIAYEKEEFVKTVRKEKRSVLLFLTRGGYYRVNVTTVVGGKETRQRSRVISGTNSEQINTWHQFYDHFPYPTMKWRFTTCSKSGRSGPSQLLCDDSYKSSSLHQLVDVDNGIQKWMTPFDGFYKIVAAGAGYEGPGGLGAVLTGHFQLKEGSVLQIAVGQRGRSSGQDMFIGGGGGSFVLTENENNEYDLESSNYELLIAAGGSGSVSTGITSSSAVNGLFTNQAGNASFVTDDKLGEGGNSKSKENSAGMPGTRGSGGGAGFYGIARLPVFSNAGDVAEPAVGFFPLVEKYRILSDPDNLEFTSFFGGRYQTADNDYSEGGFGGGGNGYFTSFGGGGGYSGGGGGPPGGYSGGGGSYIRGKNELKQKEETNNSPGYVIITVVGLPPATHGHIIFYFVISFASGIILVLICATILFVTSRCAEKYYLKKRIEESGPHIREKYRKSSVFVLTSPNAASLESDMRVSESSINSDNEAETETSTNRVQSGTSENGWKRTVEKFMGTNHETDQENCDTHSSVSSISSMASTFNGHRVDVNFRTGVVYYRGDNASRMTASSSGVESSVMDDGRDHVQSELNQGRMGSSKLNNESFSPPELSNEQQKKEFRRKLKIFHEMAENNIKNRKLEPDKTVVVSSTYL